MRNAVRSFFSWRRCLLVFLALAVAVGLLIGVLWPRQGRADPGLPAVLRWGGDSSGGEPYIIEAQRKGEEPGGFEGDLARYLADKLGLKSQFVFNDWSTLPAALGSNRIDIVLNGYEWSANREAVMASTIPYYAYRLRLIFHKDRLVRWDDLRDKPLHIGVLSDSAADNYVTKLSESNPKLKIDRLDTEGVTGVMARVKPGDFDATVQDSPVITWYMNRKGMFSDLRVDDQAIAPVPHSYYVIYTRPEDKMLRQQLDEVIRKGLENGELRAIYERYGVWNDYQQRLLAAADHWPPAESAAVPGLGWFMRTLAFAALTTIALACIAMPLAMMLGLTVALGRLYAPRWLAWPCVIYVEVIRGTPVLLQLMVIFFFLPTVGITLPAFWSGVLGLALNYGAYEAENYRAGLLAIPNGQMEAALSLGMSRLTALRRIIVPQAVRLVVPPVTNDFISLFKDTSICSAIAVTELMARYRTLMVNYQQMALQVGLITAVLYLLMSYPLSLVARRLEQGSGKGKVVA
jgi:polar amino acid transport system substrate-binding protein